MKHLKNALLGFVCGGALVQMAYLFSFSCYYLDIAGGNFPEWYKSIPMTICVGIVGAVMGASYSYQSEHTPK